MRLKVLSRGVAGDVRRVRFVVEDTGVGFSQQVAEALFDRFEQADSSITREFGGTGLGLAISRSLVDLMDGEIVASSSPGQGATFAFELPLRRVARDLAPQAPAPASSPPSADRPVRVLLAEDHPTNRRVVELILGGLPVDLTCVENGQQAQVLLGATGTGKTYTIAKVIEKVQKPTLVIAHNKTLAAQLASEFKAFFPNNYVGYFVSYYDFYQPEAYIASTDT